MIDEMEPLYFPKAFNIILKSCRVTAFVLCYLKLLASKQSMSCMDTSHQTLSSFLMICYFIQEVLAGLSDKAKYFIPSK